MDMGGKDEAETAKRNEDAMNFDSDNMPSQWQLNGANLVIPNSNPNTDSFCPAIWDRSINSPTFLHGVTASNLLGSGTVVDRNVGMFWTQPNSSGMLPQFPADSDFIERAARFSCFGGGNFCDPINPFSTTEPMNPYTKGVMPTQKAREVFAGNEQYQEHEMTNVGESSKEGEGSRQINDQKNETTFEAKQCVVEGSGNESGEPECSSPGDQDVSEGAIRECTGASKKRKQSGRIDKTKGTPPRRVDVTKDHKDQNLMSTSSKQGGKNAKKGTEASDSPNEEYIHVRARRGQATNSHSLAERVRREKISQRMKLLQDLVPGCNKVTGKAVMLDEIINYVQSLQRQVEFLSMKLATVIPRLDFNVEGLLAKDILQSQTGPSSSLAFPPDMTMPYPPINPPHPSLVQAGLPGYVNSINALQIAINSEKATMNVPNVWDHELHNLLQMGFKPNAPLNSQEDRSTSNV